MARLALAVMTVAVAGCATGSPYATTAFCTPAGVRTLPTAGVGGLVGSVNALPASGVCRAFSARPDAAATTTPGGGATPPAETPPPTK